MNKKGETGLIFKTFFSCPQTSEICKNSMNGLNDKTLQHFQPLSCSSSIKDALKPQWSEKEYIDSYIDAAIVLAQKNEELVKLQNPSVNYVLRKYYYTLPIVYLVRHSIELTLKFAIEKSGFESKPIHKVSSLWQSFTSHLPKSLHPNDNKIKKQMQVFIDIIKLLDDTEINSRYSKDKAGQQTQNKFLWINTVHLTKTCKEFITAILNVDYEYIRLSNAK